jgi:hypothetical protein
MIRSVLVKIGLATASCVSCFLLVLSIVSMVEGPPGVFWSFYFIHPVLWSAVAASQVLDPPEFYGPFWPHYQVQSTENKKSVPAYCWCRLIFFLHRAYSAGNFSGCQDPTEPVCALLRKFFKLKNSVQRNPELIRLGTVAD